MTEWTTSTLRKRNFKTEVLPWKRIECFLFTLDQTNLKKQRSPRNTQSGKSHDYRDVIVFENEKLVFSNSSGLRFRKAPFLNFSDVAWTGTSSYCDYQLSKARQSFGDEVWT